MKLVLPKASATMETGQIARWLKQPGDTVKVGDILYELNTDKAILEIESPVEGVLESILVSVDTDIAVGEVVCELRSAEEDASPENAKDAEGFERSERLESFGDSGDFNRPEEAKRAELPAAIRLRASPSARRMAREHNLDLHQLSGSGPLGRIRNVDVLAAVKRRECEHRALSADMAAIPQMRRIIARELVRSQQTIPAFWVEKWVRAGDLLQWKEKLQQTLDGGRSPLTITDFLIQAVGMALENRPEANRRWTERDGQASIEQAIGSHVGLAVSLEEDEGILVPVIEHAGKRTLMEIADARRDAVQHARYRSVATDGEPAFITLSNLGPLGVDRFRAIVRPDESMILAVGSLRERVVAESGQPVVQTGFTLTLSADHRVHDGVRAARFLAEIAAIVESGRWRLFRRETDER